MRSSVANAPGGHFDKVVGENPDMDLRVDTRVAEAEGGPSLEEYTGTECSAQALHLVVVVTLAIPLRATQELHGYSNKPGACEVIDLEAPELFLSSSSDSRFALATIICR